MPVMAANTAVAALRAGRIVVATSARPAGLASRLDACGNRAMTGVASSPNDAAEHGGDGEQRDTDDEGPFAPMVSAEPPAERHQAAEGGHVKP